ncbi:MAG: hypothetical protein DDT31_01982 [Syntrophomonadaceae bacterium]|nr:hypothetical protein [Bacillota bacterium]
MFGQNRTITKYFSNQTPIDIHIFYNHLVIVLPLEKISLDKKAFEALASETRIDILKRLDARRMTITELSKELDLAKSTIHEHLSRMSGAGLVEKKDSTNKWTYYELTKKGREILHPHETTIFAILLSSSVLALAGGVWSIYRFLVGTTAQYEKVPVEEVDIHRIPVEEIPPAPLIEAAVYDPHSQYLIIGILLILVTILLTYLTFRMWKRSHNTF